MSKSQESKHNKKKHNQRHNDADNNKSSNACFSCIEVTMVGNKDDRVLADSGILCHMFNDMAWFIEFNKREKTLNLAGECQLNLIGRGKVAAEAWVNRRWKPYFKHAMYLPKLRRNLISVGTAERVDAKVKIAQDKMKFYLDDQLKMEAQLNENNLYKLKNYNGQWWRAI